MSATELKRLPKDVVASELAAAIEHDGCAIVEGIADAGVLQRINSEPDSFVADTAPGVRYEESSRLIRSRI